MLGVLTALLVGVVLLSFPGPASAEGEVVAVGWWTRLPTASAPEGGVNVGSAPDGPNSVAAVRIDLGSGLTSLTVSATEEGGTTETATVRVCPASDVWTPAEGGALGDAPDIDCASGVAFERNDDGVWTADVTSLVAGRTGTASIGFVADGPGGENPLAAAPSEVRYQRPSAFGVPASTTTTTSSFTTTTAGGSPTTTAAATTPTTRPVVTTSPPTTAASTTTVFDERPLSSTTTAPPDDERALRPLNTAGASSGEGRPIGEAFVLVLLAGLTGVGVAGVSKWAEARG